MTEAEALQARRYHLLEQLSIAADEIKLIDSRPNSLLEGQNQGQEQHE